jgi:putative peptidoglycan lipid II flippase
MAAYQVNDLVSTSLASNAGTGVASSLQFSLRLQELILGVFAVSIGTVLLPELTECAKRTDWQAFNRRLRKGMDAIAVITIPIAVVSMLEAKDIVTILFKMKEFSETSVALTATAFVFHIAGLYFIAVNRIIAPAFYAGEDTKSPTLAGLVSFGSNVVLALFLVGPMRGGGLALALSLASAVNTGILAWLLGKKKGIDFRSTVVGAGLYAAKIVGFSFAAALPVIFLSGPVHDLFSGSQNRFVSAGLPFALLSLIFAMVGVALLIATRDENLAFILGRFGRRR